jgi:hypothetical protein
MWRTITAIGLQLLSADEAGFVLFLGSASLGVASHFSNLQTCMRRAPWRCSKCPVYEQVGNRLSLRGTGRFEQRPCSLPRRQLLQPVVKTGFKPACAASRLRVCPRGSMVCSN